MIQPIGCNTPKSSNSCTINRRRSSSSCDNLQISFGCKPTAKEAAVMTDAINQSLNLLGKKVKIIIQGSCFPAEISQNSGTGSPLSKGAKKIWNFIKQYGFSGIQEGPIGKLPTYEHSPYNTSSTSLNELFIDVFDLADSKWGNLVSREKLNDLVSNNNSVRSNFDYTRAKFVGAYNSQKDNEIGLNFIKPGYKGIMNEAYEAFTGKKESLPQLHNEFSAFKKENNDWLERDSLYHCLSIKYKNNDFYHWNSHNNPSVDWKWNDIDQRLFKLIDRTDLPEHELALERKQMLENEFEKEIDNYKFNQFVLDKQMKSTKELANKNGLTRLTDIPIGCDHNDFWAYRDAFEVDDPNIKLKKYSTQWGGYLPHPAKLFSEDGNILGPAGKFLYQKYSRPLKYYDGFRIDVAPILYDYKMNGRDKENYSKIYEKIIHPMLNEHGMWDDKKGCYKNIVAEAMGDIPAEFRSQEEFEGRVLKGIPAIYQTIYGNDIRKSKAMHTAILTCHDQPSFREYIANPEKYEFADKIKYYREGNYWGEYTDEPNSLFDNYLSYLSRMTGFDKSKMASDDVEFSKAKFAELFAGNSENIDISYDDFFGLIKEEDIYNIGNAENVPHCWEARISENFEQQYYENLIKEDAINLPEILAKVIQQNFGYSQSDLVKRLNDSAAILKKPETTISETTISDKKSKIKPWQIITGSSVIAGLGAFLTIFNKKKTTSSASSKQQKQTDTPNLPQKTQNTSVINKKIKENSIFSQFQLNS